MMRLFAKVLMLVGCLTISTQILALGLGELTLRSALNQPLDAEIELVDAEGLSQWEIKPFLASNVAFEQAAVDTVAVGLHTFLLVDGRTLAHSHVRALHELDGQKDHCKLHK